MSSTNFKGAFVWEIWIKILKYGFRICNRTRNPKPDFNARISVLGFPIFPFFGGNPKKDLKNCS